MSPRIHHENEDANVDHEAFGDKPADVRVSLIVSHFVRHAKPGFRGGY
jgi:hypothetical protein